MEEKIKTQKGFIQIPILIAIIIAILIVGTGVYFGIKQYQNYQIQKTGKENPAQEEEIEQKRKEKQEIEKLKEEIENLKNQKSPIIKEISSKNSENQKNQQSSNISSQPPQSVDISSIIDKWKPLVVYIKCDFFNQDGTYAFSQAGSGTLFAFSDGIGIQTNKHVISKQLPLTGGLATPDYCSVKFLGNSRLYYVYHHTTSGVFNMQAADDGSDGGRLIIREPDNFIANLLVQYQGFYCKRKPSLGESVVILGYPSIGSPTDITATEGIISSYEYSNAGNYYVTSAKVEHGNSGGAAILVKDNCYLGIPTFAQVGEIESLARILDEPGLLK
jgi:cell division protein FtsB